MSSKKPTKNIEIVQADEVDDYFYSLLFNDDDVPAKILKRCHEEGLPMINVTPHQGRLLNFLIKIQQSKRVLEIGTLGGYSTAWMALALAQDGQIISLEQKEEFAALARENMRNAGLDNKVEIIQGDASDALEAMIKEGAAPFDFIFIDADKHNNPLYLDYALKLSRPGTLIFADNMVRRGKILDPDHQADNVRGIQEYLQKLSTNDDVESTAIQTVGGKIWDGFALTMVKNVHS